MPILQGGAQAQRGQIITGTWSHSMLLVEKGFELRQSGSVTRGLNCFRILVTLSSACFPLH